MLSEIGNRCPLELFYHVINFDKFNLIPLSLLNRKFNELAHAFVQDNLPLKCFGEKEWRRYKGNPGVVTHLPFQLFLNFDSSKEILTFIPETINDEELNLNTIDAFVSAFCNVKTCYKFPLKSAGIYEKTLKKTEAHWVKLSKDILPETSEKTFSEIRAILNSKGFEIPDLVDVVVSLFMHFLNTNEFLFSSTFTSVLEANDFRCSLVVGNFSSQGLTISNWSQALKNIGSAYSISG